MGIIKTMILFIISQLKLAYDQSMKIVLGVSQIERSNVPINSEGMEIRKSMLSLLYKKGEI